MVTGATGFIGSALVRKLLEKSYEVIELSSKDGDIAESSTLDKYNQTEFVRIFHLAGLTYVPGSWESPLDYYRTNVLGTANVVDFCRLKNTPITFISAYIYGQPEFLPINEDHSISPNNPYAFTKYAAENICEFYAKNFNISCAVIRPFNVYGVGQSPDFIIPSIIDQVLNKEKIIVNDLTPCRDYVNIEDLVNAIIKTFECRGEYNVYNIGSGNSLSVEEVINIIQQSVKTNKPVISKGNTRINEIPDVVADISRAGNELEWFPHVSFAAGIDAMIMKMRRDVPN